VPDSPEPFPPEHVTLLLDAARAAPSIHNTQPWRFEVRGDRVEVWADRSRALPAIDPDGRQLLVSCGAAVLNLRVVMAHLGFAPVTTLLPDPGDPDHLATVARGAARAPSPTDRALYEMIRWRRTDRGRYREQPVPAPVLRRLVAAVERESALLWWVDGPRERTAVAGLVERGIEQEAGSPEVRAEFARSLSEETEPASGTPLRSWLDAPYPVPALTGRDRLTPAERSELLELLGESTVGVLCTAGDGPADRLCAGQALQRMLLTATAAGVAVSFLNQPVEVPPLRARLGDVLGDALGLAAVPQMVLRAGYSRQRAARTGRRPPG
jgi:nitroreductase